MSFWLIALNWKGIEGLFLGESRCYDVWISINWDCEVRIGRTTWRASLATRAVEVRCRH